MVYQDPILQDVFEGDPLGRQGIFNAQLPNVMGQQLKYLQSLYQPTFDRYLGQLVQDPSLRFTGFLNSSFNPQRELARASGEDIGSLRTPTLFNLR